jgi:predicted transcriptional regulator
MERRRIIMTTADLSRVEVFGQLRERVLTQSQTAHLLGISVRQVKRLFRGYKKHGAKALISNKLGKPSNNQTSKALKESVLALIIKNYADFGPTLAHEKIREEHRLRISVTSVRKMMIFEGLWDPRRVKKKRVFQLRERRSLEGELGQMDGSPHDWFEGRAPKCSLLVCVDDATGKLMMGLFTSSETIWGYFDFLMLYLKKHGRPLAFYTDMHAVFRVNRAGALNSEGVTEFGRAMKELDIKMIFARTPQAKGRVEKMNRTLQDRLVKELRIRKISTMEEANVFLPTFIDSFNRRFAVVPKNPNNAHRKLLLEHNLEHIFTLQETRWLSKNLTFQYQNTIYQIKTNRESYALRKTKVFVHEYKDGSIKVFYKGVPLDFTVYERQEKQGEIVDAKQLNEVVDRLQRVQRETLRKPKYRPSINHPYKCYYRRLKLNKHI